MLVFLLESTTNPCVRNEKLNEKVDNGSMYSLHSKNNVSGACIEKYFQM